MLDKISFSKKFQKEVSLIVKKIVRDETRSCFRLEKAVVVTAPQNNVCGVTLIGDSTILNIPYVSKVSNAKVGDVVWVGVIYNSLQNAFVWDSEKTIFN